MPMRGFLASGGVAACGLITSVLTAIAVLIVERLVGLNLFTLMIWLIVPAGALITGAAAASGYYFGSLYFHTRPGVVLLLQMVLIAGFTQWLIYYMGYLTLVLNDGRLVSDVIYFSDYLEVLLTKAQYRVGRAQTKTGELGEAGYWIAVLQFVGFLIGGLACFGFLRDRPTCPTCRKYYRPLSSIEKQFSDRELFVSYYEDLFRIPVDAPLFAEAIRAKPAKTKAAKGTIHLRSALLGCPTCKQQVIEDKVQVCTGSGWNEIRDLHRRTLLPEGINLTPIFRSK
jgi:hypothetical protein